MPLFNDQNRNLFLGLAIGVGVGYLGRDFLKEAGKPLLKSAMKSGILSYEKGREQLARLGEDVEDMIVEVRAEMEQEAAAAGERTLEIEEEETSPASGEDGADQ